MKRFRKTYLFKFLSIGMLDLNYIIFLSLYFHSHSLHFHSDFMYIMYIPLLLFFIMLYDDPPRNDQFSYTRYVNLFYILFRFFFVVILTNKHFYRISISFVKNAVLW